MNKKMTKKGNLTKEDTNEIIEQLQKTITAIAGTIQVMRKGETQ